MKKSGLVVILAAVCVVLAIALTVAITYRVALEPMHKQIAALKNTVEKMSNQKQVVATTPSVQPASQPQDGKTPPCYYEKDQCRGQNSVSTNTEVKSVETVIKEQQTASPYKDIRYNPETGVETKMSNEQFWEIIVPCQLLTVGCINVTIPAVKPLNELVEL